MEVLVALVILTYVMLTLMPIFHYSNQQMTLARQRSFAVGLVRARMDELISGNYNSITNLDEEIETNLKIADYIRRTTVLPAFDHMKLVKVEVIWPTAGRIDLEMINEKLGNIKSEGHIMRVEATTYILEKN